MVAEFGNRALQAFGQEGADLLPIPSVIREAVEAQYGAVVLQAALKIIRLERLYLN